MKRSKEKQGAARRKTHPLELKLQVLQQLNAGASVSDVCRAFGLAVTTVALWRRRKPTASQRRAFCREGNRSDHGT
jgi:transposase-like protein